MSSVQCLGLVVAFLSAMNTSWFLLSFTLSVFKMDIQDLRAPVTISGILVPVVSRSSLLDPTASLFT